MLRSCFGEELRGILVMVRLSFSMFAIWVFNLFCLFRKVMMDRPVLLLFDLRSLLCPDSRHLPFLAQVFVHLEPRSSTKLDVVHLIWWTDLRITMCCANFTSAYGIVSDDAGTIRCTCSVTLNTPVIHVRQWFNTKVLSVNVSNDYETNSLAGYLGIF